MERSKLFLLWVMAAACYSVNVFGQSGLCNSGVPFFAVDLTGQPDGAYISPSVSRSNHCCGTGNPDRCIEFQIILDPAAVGINFEIYSGAQPPGALYYQINCGPAVPVGQQICLSGAGPHTLTFCKPGNNKNQYRITSIKGYTRGADVTTVEDCSVDLHVTGMLNSTIVWRDITGSGYYENFLSCTTGCADVSFTTLSGFPSFVDFEVCGKINSTVCQSIMQTICDTIRVNIEPAMQISYTPEPAAFCEADTSKLMTVSIQPHKSTYIISWMSGPDGSGSVLGNDTFYYAPSPGTYSIVVVDTEFSMCSSDTVNIPIVFIPSPSVVTAPGNVSVCLGESVTLTASGTASYSWNPASALSCSDCASPAASPAATTSYIVTGTDSNGCSADDTMTVIVIQPTYASLSFSICDGDSVTVGNSVYTRAGIYHDTLMSASGCDSIITTTLQVRHNSFTLIDTVICNGTSVIAGNSVYSSPGTYFDTLPAFNGCDSIIETHLAVHPAGVCDNPDLTPCPQRIIFVLDESGSIAGAGGGGAVNINTQVRNAASAFINSLNGTGTQVTVVEFNSTARRASIGGSTGYSVVNSAYITQFNNYVALDDNTTGSSDSYDPEDYSCVVPQNCYTNWEDAFEEVYNINSSLGLADLVIFFTDGQPTAYNNSWGNVTVGTGTAAINQALLEATGMANAVQMQGSHVFVIALPNSTLPESHVQQISGLERYPDQQQNFLKGDYQMTTSAQLVANLQNIGLLICRADLSLVKKANIINVCAGAEVNFTVIVTNNGTVDASGIVVKDYLPDGYIYVNDDGGAATSLSGNTLTWDVGTLLNGQSDTLLLTASVNASGNYKNVAEVTASDKADGDSTPNNDDGDQSEDDEDAASVTIVNCDDGNLCTTDVCISGNCIHTYLPASCSISGNNDICYGESTQFTASGGVLYSWTGPNGFLQTGANTGAVSDAGNYSVTVTNANGCTSTCSVTLTVKSLPSCNINGDNYICPLESSTFTASGGIAYSWSGPNGFSATAPVISGITAPGNYAVALTGANGCSSTCSRMLNQLNTSLTTIDDTICEGITYLLATKSYTSSGIYYDTLNSSNGCDSVLMLNLHVVPLSYGPFDITICQGDSAVIGSSVYYSSGVYYDTFMSARGCDSIVISSVRVSNHSQIFNNATICAGESLTVGNSTYTGTGVYYDTLLSATGCDSIIQTNLLVLPVRFTMIDTVICAGVFRDTFISSTGCDSIVISSLKILNHSQTVLSSMICSGESFSVGNSGYSSTGIYFDTLMSGNGCDSIVQLNLLVIPPVGAVMDTSICAGENFVVGGSTYTSSGTYYDTLVSSTGCDSVIQTNLHVLPIHVTVIDTSICFGENFSVGGSNYNLSGTYNDTFAAASGCDSIVITYLQVRPEVYGPFRITICKGDSIAIGSSVYHDSGFHYDTLVSSLGCDSIVHSSIAVINSRHTVINQTLCQGSTLTVGSSVYSTSGIYYDTLTAASGCDSIVETQLQILKKSYKALTAEICQGQKFYVGNHWYTNTGVYFDTLRAANGCDSVIITNLKVYPTKFSTLVVSICQGDSVVVGTSVYRNTGTYLNRFQTFHGCDSIVQTKLTVWPEIHGAQDRFICRGNTIPFNLTGGIQYAWTPATSLSCSNCSNPVASPKDDISYFVRVTDIHGCTGYDTIHVDVSHVDLTINASDNEVCEGDAVLFSQTYNSDYPLASRMWDFGDGFLTANPNPVHGYFNDGVYSVKLTASNWRGCSASDSLKITINSRPEISLNGDTAICPGDSVQLHASGADSYAWLPTTFLNNPDIPDPVAAPASDIQYNVVGISSNGCLNHATVSIVLNPVPNLWVSPDVSVCPNGSAALYATGGITYNWSPPDGLSNPTAQFTMASPDATTIYRIRAYNQYGCEAVDSVKATVYPKTELKVSPNGEICRGDKLPLMATGAEHYRWTPPAGLSCAECETTEASPASTTNYSVAATDVYGCKYMDSVSVFVREIPYVSTRQDITICKGEPVMLETDTAAADDVRWFPQNFLDNPENLSPVAFPAQSITYVVSASNRYGCKSDDSVRINVIEKVDAELIGADVCRGERVRLQAQVNLASENGYDVRWLPDNLFDDVHAPAQFFTPQENTEISVIVSSKTCKPDTATSFIHLHESPEVDAGLGKIVYVGEEVMLTASSNSLINSYSWFPSERLECSACSAAIWVADQSRWFTVRVVDENGCHAVDSVLYRVAGSCREDVYIPNAFTPNGDELNDRLRVRSQTPITLNYFKIFDRWGNQVYSSDDVNEGWDGTCKGRDAVAGVYVYHLMAGCRNGESMFLKGNVTVIR